ncbi:MAG: histidine kinase dimerization/phospho-acceptor domain-containing protein, partial [Rhodospirillales bacterium]
MRKTKPASLSPDIENFVAAFDCSPHLCAWYDADDRLRWMNRAFARAYEDYADIVVIGRDFTEMMREVDARREIPEASYDPQWLEKRIAYRRNPSGSLLRPMPDGFRYSLTEWRTPDGGTMSLFTQATATSEQSMLYDSIMSNMRDIVFCRSERGDNTVRTVGPGAEAFLGFSTPADGPGHAPEEWYALVHPDDREAYVSAEKRRKQDGTSYAMEYRFRHPVTGIWHWAREVAWNTEDEATGRLFYDSYVVDRTNAKERETAEQHLREVLDAATDIIAIFSADGRLAYLNSGARSGLKLAGDLDISGHRITDFLPTSVRHMLLHDAMHQARLNGTWAGELVFRTTEGNTLPCSVVLVSHRNTGGQVDRFSVIARDISRQREAEYELRVMRDRAEEANRAKSRFLATMSHELRTPLNAIIGFSELMSEEIFGPIGAPRYREYLKDIRNSATHLLGLIGDVLDVSRIEAGKIDLDPEWLDVRVVSAEMVDMVQARAQQKGLQLRLEMPEDLPPVYADNRTFRQCLLNLLSNAIKFTPADGLVSVGADAGDPLVYQVWVTDTGRGIPADQIEKVLEPFSQVEE